MKGLWALAVVSLVAAAPAEAQFFTDNSDTYATGSTIMGQGGWETWDTNPGANTTLERDPVLHRPQRAAGGRTGRHRAPVHRASTAGPGTHGPRVFIPSTSTGEAWFILLNQYAPAATDDNWSVSGRLLRHRLHHRGRPARDGREPGRQRAWRAPAWRR